MTSRDAMEGGERERIPPHAKPGDVIYGDPEDVDGLALKLLAYAGAFKDGLEKLDDLSLMDWTGAGSEAFMDATRALPGNWSRPRSTSRPPGRPWTPTRTRCAPSTRG